MAPSAGRVKVDLVKVERTLGSFVELRYAVRRTPQAARAAS